MLLGDAVAKAIHIAGIDERDVEAFLGPDCGCGERQEKMNSLHRWAARIVSGKLERAKELFASISSGWR